MSCFICRILWCFICTMQYYCLKKLAKMNLQNVKDWWLNLWLCLTIYLLLLFIFVYSLNTSYHNLYYVFTFLMLVYCLIFPWLSATNFIFLFHTFKIYHKKISFFRFAISSFVTLSILLTILSGIRQLPEPVSEYS